MGHGLYDEHIRLPRAVKFPVELRTPDGFQPDQPSSWPHVDGRLEFVGGKLLYMPPCGDMQGPVTTSVAVILGTWAEQHSDFIVATNEAGMILGGEVRGVDAGVWRRDAAGPPSGRYYRVAPVLAVEVAGADEGESELRQKAAWYLSHGVLVVWVVLPATREVVVLSRGTDTRHGGGESIATHAALPGLAPRAERFFQQLD